MNIQDNINTHDRNAASYDSSHQEIYNPVEQDRIAEVITMLVGLSSSRPYVLDYGAGTGNLTGHFLNAGAKVASGDVSQVSLDIINKKYDNNAVETLLLNGENLEGIEDNSFDVVAFYSVIHHIPDYLLAVREALRVLKPGGYLMIDHEHNEQYREQQETFSYLYQSADRRTVLQKIVGILGHPQELFKHLSILWHKLSNPKYQYEGDIHVRPDDHIQREEIIELITLHGGTIHSNSDYLNFRPGYDPHVYALLAKELQDMKLLIARV